MTPFLGTNNSNSIATYSWAGPNGFTSTEITPTISNVSAANEGVYSVTATFTNGCVGTATASATLTLSTLPSFSILERRLKYNNTQATVNCLGATVELIAQTGGSIINSISWTGPNGFSSTALSPQIVNTTAANTGYYYATVNLGGECPATITRGSFLTFTNASSLPFAITRENTNPTGDNRSICTGSNIRLVANPNSTNYFQGTYSWTGPNGFTSTDIAPTITNIDASKLGTYTLNVNYTDGCVGTASSSITLNTNPPTVSILRATGAGCVGLPITLSVSNTTSADTSYGLVQMVLQVIKVE
jgi:trimeric autotransporter adhesin